MVSACHRLRASIVRGRDGLLTRLAEELLDILSRTVTGRAHRNYLGVAATALLLEEGMVLPPAILHRSRVGALRELVVLNSSAAPLVHQLRRQTAEALLAAALGTWVSAGDDVHGGRTDRLAKFLFLLDLGGLLEFFFIHFFVITSANIRILVELFVILLRL